MGWFKETMGQVSLEFPVRNKNISDLALQLEASGKEITERIASAQADSDENQAKMRHIIGIERWGQNRLRGFLGDSPSEDEHDEYCPEDGLDLTEQIALFKEARAKTIYLGIQIESLFANRAKASAPQAEKAAEKEVEKEVVAEPASDMVANGTSSDGTGQDDPAENAVTYTVNHNEYGPLTPRGWLRYLEMHARMESRSIK